MSGARRLPRNQQPTKSARIFEGRHGLDGVLRSSGKNDLAVAFLQLADGDGDVMLAYAEESAGADDGVGDRFVRRDDDVVSFSDRFTFVVVDQLSQDLPPGAPSYGDVPQFSHGYAQLRGAHNLLTLRRADCAQQHRTHAHRYRDGSLHDFLLAMTRWFRIWPHRSASDSGAFARRRRLYAVGIHAGNDGFDGRSLSLVDRSSGNFHRSSSVVLGKIGTSAESFYIPLLLPLRDLVVGHRLLLLDPCFQFCLGRCSAGLLLLRLVLKRRNLRFRLDLGLFARTDSVPLYLLHALIPFVLLVAYLS